MGIQIIIRNANQCQLEGDIKLLGKLYTKFSYKHHNAWFILQKTRTKWDGYVRYISKTGFFKIGLLGMVYEEACKLSKDVTITDKRPSLGVKPKISPTLGNLTLRPDQINTLKKILNNKVGGIPFLICSANLAVGFGKSLLFCSIHKAFQSKLNTVLLLNDSDLFNQFKTELPKLLPEETITFIQGNKVEKWTKFNVAMVQSLYKNLDTYQRQLESIQICLIDESDVIDNNTFKAVLMHLYNTSVRIGLSGTLYKGKLKKHLIPNMNIRSFIGDVADEVKLADQMKKGTSTKTIIKSITLNYPVKPSLSYEEEYRSVIIENPLAYEVVLQRINYNLKYDRLPMLIATKFIDHTDKMEAFLKKHLPYLTVKGVHHKTPNRSSVLDEFREGKIDILIATTIISRGKNIPLLQYTCNASSMDAEERTIQLVGRSVRLHHSKSKAVIDDLIFPGKYLTRHGNHRRNYYLRENLKVIKVPRKAKKPKNK